MSKTSDINKKNAKMNINLNRDFDKLAKNLRENLIRRKQKTRIQNHQTAVKEKTDEKIN